MLRQVAQRLCAVVRETDTVARLGGDEFVILAAGFVGDGIDSACALAQKCVEAIGEPLEVDGTRHTFGAAIGIALSRDGDYDRADSLLAAADRAMYVVKQRGTAGFSVATATG